MPFFFLKKKMVRGFTVCVCGKAAEGATCFMVIHIFHVAKKRKKEGIIDIALAFGGGKASVGVDIDILQLKF